MKADSPQPIRIAYDGGAAPTLYISIRHESLEPGFAFNTENQAEIDALATWVQSHPRLLEIAALAYELSGRVWPPQSGDKAGGPPKPFDR